MKPCTLQLIASWHAIAIFSLFANIRQATSQSQSNGGSGDDTDYDSDYNSGGGGSASDSGRLLHASRVSTSPPHIIFILADDVGWNDVGFHGSLQVQTPNIDRLAREGIILENYYGQMLCTPSRSALLTGRYPSNTGMQHFVITPSEPWGLDPDVTILPQYLKPLGYATHIVGKWHQGFYLKKYLPTYRGFDTHYGSYFQHDYFEHLSYDDMLNVTGYDFHENVGRQTDITPDLIEKTRGQYQTDLYAQRAVDIINEHDAASQPLFLYLSHLATHAGNPNDPLQTTPERLELFKGVSNPNRREFLAMLKALDDSVGKVFEACQQKGIDHNMIFVFSSDNGGPVAGFGQNYASNWPLRGGKNQLYEGGVHLSGFIWSPRLENTAYRSHHLMHMTDWLPTLVHQAAKSSSPELHRTTMISLDTAQLDGYDMWHALSKKTTNSPRHEMLLQYDPVFEWGGLRFEGWKLLVNEGVQPFKKDSIRYKPEGDDDPRTTVDCGPQGSDFGADSKYHCNATVSPCLFNIDEDPCEMKNLASDYPDLLEKMMKRYARYKQTSVPPRNRPCDPCANPQLFGGLWTTWLEYTGGEAYEPYLTTFKSRDEMILYDNLSFNGTVCKRPVDQQLPVM